MHSIKNFLTVVALTLAVVFICTSANAETINPISIVDITGDADCGINKEKTYTHTLDFGATNSVAATVNEVAFTVIGRDPNIYQTPMVINGTNLRMETFPTPDVTTGFNYPLKDTTSVPTTDGMYNLLVDGLYSHGYQVHAKATLSGLVSGESYDLRLYYRSNDVNGTRDVTYNYDVGDDGSVEHAQDVNQDAGNGAHYISYLYEAPASGIISVDMVFADTGVSGCWYGLTNEVASEIPEPSTLALLACGLLGLLAYAWRKRK